MDSLDDDIMGKVEPLDEREASEEEPVDGRDGVSDGRVGEVVRAVSELFSNELAVVDDGRDGTDKGEQVECLEEGWRHRHRGIYVYICRKGEEVKGEEEGGDRRKEEEEKGERRKKKERKRKRRTKKSAHFSRLASRGMPPRVISC